MPRFGTPFRNAFAARPRRKPEVFSKELEGFFRRALGLYTCKFPKRGAASLMYLPRSHLDLPCSRLGLPRLRLSRNSSPVTEGFSNRGINFKDAYRKLLQFVVGMNLIATQQPCDPTTATDNSRNRQWTNNALYIFQFVTMW